MKKNVIGFFKVLTTRTRTEDNILKTIEFRGNRSDKSSILVNDIELRKKCENVNIFKGSFEWNLSINQILVSCTDEYLLNKICGNGNLIYAIERDWSYKLGVRYCVYELELVDIAHDNTTIKPVNKFTHSIPRVQYAIKYRYNSNISPEDEYNKLTTSPRLCEMLKTESLFITSHKTIMRNAEDNLTIDLKDIIGKVVCIEREYIGVEFYPDKISMQSIKDNIDKLYISSVIIAHHNLRTKEIVLDDISRLVIFGI